MTSEKKLRNIGASKVLCGCSKTLGFEESVSFGESSDMYASR